MVLVSRIQALIDCLESIAEENERDGRHARIWYATLRAVKAETLAYEQRRISSRLREYLKEAKDEGK